MFELTDQNLRATIFHELGHVAVGVHHGAEIEEISIGLKRFEAYAGRVTPRIDLQGDELAEMLVAGPIAGALFEIWHSYSECADGEPHPLCRLGETDLTLPNVKGYCVQPHEATSLLEAFGPLRVKPQTRNRYSFSPEARVRTNQWTSDLERFCEITEDNESREQRFDSARKIVNSSWVAISVRAERIFRQELQIEWFGQSIPVAYLK